MKVIINFVLNLADIADLFFHAKKGYAQSAQIMKLKMKHMLFSCTLYNTLREHFLIKQQHIINTTFDNYEYWLSILFTTENKAF